MTVILTLTPLLSSVLLVLRLSLSLLSFSSVSPTLALRLSVDHPLNRRGNPSQPIGPCTLVNPITKEIIDLNRLSQTTGVDHQAVDEESGDIFKINICRAVLTEVWGPQDPDSVGIYRQRGRYKGESLGRYNTTLIPHGNSASIIYGDGSPCRSNPQVKMGSIVSFLCAHDVWDAGAPVFAGSIDGCQFFFTWRTSFACGSVQRSLWHSFQVIMMALFVILGLYYVLFSFYRRFHLNLRGRDQLPPTPLSSLAPIISVISRKLEEIFAQLFGWSTQLRRRQAGQHEGYSSRRIETWWEQQQEQQHHIFHHPSSSPSPHPERSPPSPKETTHLSIPSIELRDTNYRVFDDCPQPLPRSSNSSSSSLNTIAPSAPTHPS